MKPARILHLVQRYAPAVGGSEKYFQEFSRRFARDGFPVTVLTTDALDLEAFWLPGRKRVDREQETIDGVQVERFKTWVFPQQGRLWKLLVLWPGDGAKLRYHFPSPIVPGLWKRLRALDGQFDLVHAGSLPYNSILYAAERYAKRNGVPLIYSPFMHPGEEGESDLIRWYARGDQLRLLAWADRLIVQSPSEARFFEQRGIPSNRMTILGAGIEPSEFNSPVEQGRAGTEFLNRLPSEGFVFQIGPLTKDKGTLFLVEAMRRLWDQGESIPLVLAGKPMTDFEPYWNQLPPEVQRKIVRTGFVSEEEKRILFSRGTLLAHPSRSESFGIVFLEAWAAGKPVIGARAGGVADLIEPGEDGRLVKFGDEEDLANSIRELWQDPELRERMARRGKAKTLQRYTWDALYGRLKNVYCSVSEL
jgi:glycosyltransferase involved in cell wall biosynthesis